MGWPLGMVDCDQYLVEDILQPWLAKGPKPMRVWGKEGMTWPDIVDGGSAGMEASVALATECSGHPLATVMLTFGARGLFGNGGAARKEEAAGARVGNTHVLMRKG
jgi:hypothetical protein